MNRGERGSAAMTNNRLFTDQELKEMGTRTLDAALAAIDAGEKDKAKELVKRMYGEFNHLHDGYMFWVTGLQTYIYEHYGIEAVEAAERFAHAIEAQVVFKPPEKTDVRSRVEHMASGLRGHLQPVVIEEDDEKVSLTMKPCGSGERLIRYGGYDVGLAKVKEAHPITWGREDFPIYCVHCPVMEMLEVESTGKISMVHFESDALGDGNCHFVFYKDPDAIPDQFYDRIGKKKPAAK
jgi:hypothetical protein